MAQNELKATFTLEKETKNCLRYQEETEGYPIVGSLYVQKGALRLLSPGNPLGEVLQTEMDFLPRSEAAAKFEVYVRFPETSYFRVKSSPFCPRLKMVPPLGSSGLSPSSTASRSMPSTRETLGAYPRDLIFEMSATRR